MQLNLTARIKLDILENYTYYSREGIKFDARPCIYGEIYNIHLFRCEFCEEDYYTVGDPMDNYECRKCDLDRMICPGGNVLFPKPGYWRWNDDSDNFLKCRAPEACLGGNILNLNGVCAEGYMGNACGTCEPEHGRFGNDNQCTPCRNNSWYYFRFSAYFLTQIVLWTLNIRANARVHFLTQMNSDEELRS